jgi:hypothetical protein
MIHRYANSLNAFFTMVLLLRSHLCTILVDPSPAPHALDHITHFVQFAVCKTSSAYVLQRFLGGKLALLSSTWDFIFQLHFVRWAGEDCSNRCLPCPYSIAFRQKWYFFNLPCKELSTLVWALFIFYTSYGSVDIFIIHLFNRVQVSIRPS